MALEATHPQYDRCYPDWVVCRDAYDGERAVKERGSEYLPPTASMELDGMAHGQRGRAAYDAYRRRARVPDYMSATVSALLGAMHHKPPTVELPARMAGLLERITPLGESLPMLLRAINEQQLISGRAALLLDVPDGAGPTALPYVALYYAEALRNWDVAVRIEPDEPSLAINVAVLDESGEVMTPDLDWEDRALYRLCRLSGNRYLTGAFEDGSSTPSDDQLRSPTLAGRELSRVPLVVVNATDVDPEPARPPLLGLAELVMTIYRLEADYRQTLFMQGQETLLLVGSNEDDDVRTGANAVIHLPLGGSGEFIGVSGESLEEMREALQNDRTEAGQHGGRLQETASRERESGDALRIRVGSQTTTLNGVARAGAYGLQTVLRYAAEWMEEDPSKVIVEPNMDFVADDLAGKELVELMTAKTLGAPLSLRSIHETMERRDLTERSYEEEMAEIEAEEPLGGGITDADLGTDDVPGAGPSPPNQGRRPPPGRG